MAQSSNIGGGPGASGRSFFRSFRTVMTIPPTVKYNGHNYRAMCKGIQEFDHMEHPIDVLLKK